MVSYPSLNLTLCPEDEQTHGPGHPSLKESPGHCLEKKRERKWVFYIKEMVGSEKKKNL